jgi:anti-sigma factor RsiW
MKDAETLLRELEGTLSADEHREFEDALGKRPEFAAKRRRWRRIVEESALARTAAFRPMFTDRVMVRIREARLGEDSMYRHLRWMSARVATACVVLALALGVYNAVDNPEFSETVVETLFGMPTPSLESVVMLADV